MNIFTICTIRNQPDILKTAVADVSKGQTDMSHTGDLQTLTKLSMRYQVCPSEICCTIILESIIIMLMSVTIYLRVDTKNTPYYKNTLLLPLVLKE